MYSSVFGPYSTRLKALSSAYILAFGIACNTPVFADNKKASLSNEFNTKTELSLNKPPKAFSIWNDGGNYDDFLEIVKEYKDEIRKKLNRIPLFHTEIINFFESYQDENVRKRFSSVYGRVQMSTNCYAFAVNDPHGHRPGKNPSPGIAAGIIITPTDTGNGDIVASLAQKDGIIPAPKNAGQKEGYYRIALVIDQGKDFHWYREHTDGSWYHKIGHMQVSNTDASGQVIYNPEHVDRDYSGIGLNNYSKFYGYFYAPTNGIDLNTPASKNAKIILNPKPS